MPPDGVCLQRATPRCRRARWPPKQACRCRRSTTTSVPRAASCSPCSKTRTAASSPARPRCTPRRRRCGSATSRPATSSRMTSSRATCACLQEMIAAGWSTPAIGDKVRAMQQAWYELLTDVATEAARRFGGLGPFAPAEVATLIGVSFIGAESLLLLGFDRHQLPIRAALRRVGQLIREFEETSP